MIDLRTMSQDELDYRQGQCPRVNNDESNPSNELGRQLSDEWHRRNRIAVCAKETRG